MYGKNAASSLFLPFFHLLYAAASNTTTAAAAASVAAHSMKPSIHSLSLFHTSQQPSTMYGRLFTYWQPVFIFLTFHSASRAYFNIALKIEIMECLLWYH